MFMKEFLIYRATVVFWSLGTPVVIATGTRLTVDLIVIPNDDFVVAELNVNTVVNMWSDCRARSDSLGPDNRLPWKLKRGKESGGR